MSQQTQSENIQAAAKVFIAEQMFESTLNFAEFFDAVDQAVKEAKELFVGAALESCDPE
jgi:hypothetical protein